MPTLNTLASDQRDWARTFGVEAVAFLFPLVPTCEISSMPLFGCECNGCAEARLDDLRSVAS